MKNQWAYYEVMKAFQILQTVSNDSSVEASDSIELEKVTDKLRDIAETFI